MAVGHAAKTATIMVSNIDKVLSREASLDVLDEKACWSHAHITATAISIQNRFPLYQQAPPPSQSCSSTAPGASRGRRRICGGGCGARTARHVARSHHSSHAQLAQRHIHSCTQQWLLILAALVLIGGGAGAAGLDGSPIRDICCSSVLPAQVTARLLIAVLFCLPSKCTFAQMFAYTCAAAGASPHSYVVDAGRRAVARRLAASARR